MAPLNTLEFKLLTHTMIKNNKNNEESHIKHILIKQDEIKNTLNFVFNEEQCRSQLNQVLTKEEMKREKTKLL